MNTLGNPKGVFDLDNSDVNVGSYIKKKDLFNIFTLNNIEINNLDLEYEIVNGEEEEVIDERKLQKGLVLKDRFSIRAGEAGGEVPS